MSRTKNAINAIVQDTYFKKTSNTINDAAIKNMESAANKAIDELTGLSNQYRHDDNRSGVLKCEVAKITLSESLNLIHSTLNISSVQINTDQQGANFLGNLQSKLTELVTPNDYDDAATSAKKTFMYEAQMMYAEKRPNIQNQIDQRIVDIISPVLQTPLFNAAVKLFDCSRESSQNFVQMVHTPAVRFDNEPYREPKQDPTLTRNTLSAEQIKRVEAEFKEEYQRHAKDPSWNGPDGF